MNHIPSNAEVKFAEIDMEHLLNHETLHLHQAEVIIFNNSFVNFASQMEDHKVKYGPVCPSEKSQTQNNQTIFQTLPSNKTFDTFEIGQIFLPPDISEL